MSEWPELPECVKMKHRIQEQLEEEYRGLSDDERNKLIREKIDAHPLFGPLVRRLPRIQPQPPSPVVRAAESPAPYGSD